MKLQQPTPTALGSADYDPQGWTPKPTTAPAVLFPRQDSYVTVGKTCGFYSAFDNAPYVCPNTLTCVGAPSFSYFGCCPAGQSCLQPWTACIDYTNTAARSSCSSRGANGCTPLFTTICGSDTPYCSTNQLVYQASSGAPVQSFNGILCAQSSPATSEYTIFQPRALSTTTSISTSSSSSGSSSTSSRSTTPSSAAPSSAAPSTASPTQSSTAPPTSSAASGSSNTGAIAGGVVGGLAGLALIAAVVAYVALKMRKSRQMADTSVPMLQTTYVDGPR